MYRVNMKLIVFKHEFNNHQIIKFLLLSLYHNILLRQWINKTDVLKLKMGYNVE